MFQWTVVLSVCRSVITIEQFSCLLNKNYTCMSYVYIFQMGKAVQICLFNLIFIIS